MILFFKNFLISLNYFFLRQLAKGHFSTTTKNYPILPLFLFQYRVLWNYLKKSFIFLRYIYATANTQRRWFAKLLSFLSGFFISFLIKGPWLSNSITFNFIINLSVLNCLIIFCFFKLSSFGRRFSSKNWFLRSRNYSKKEIDFFFVNKNR